MKILPETIAKIKTVVDPSLLLDTLGFQVVRTTSKELRGPCKIHGGDNPTAFRFNTEAKTWCCYTRHCEGSEDRDVIGLVMRATGQSFSDSVRFLANLCGVDLTDQNKLTPEFLRLKREQEIRKDIKEAGSKSQEKKFFPEEIMESYIPRRSNYFIERGFPAELLDFFQVGGMIDEYGIPRETIPIRDENGNLLTISGRRTDSDADPKYRLLNNIKKTDTLYNLDVAKEVARNKLPRVLILVEGFVDVWTLALHGLWNAVAIMGTGLAPAQIHLLSKYADDIIVMLDPDKAGREATAHVEKMLKFYTGVDVKNIDKDPKYLNYNDVRKLFGGMLDV